MGVDAGFDMVPRLSKGAVDRENWHSFIELIKDFYKDDDLVEVKPNHIVFKAGEHPRLPFEGQKFLRFSSKISGRQARGVEKYINRVTRMARLNFGCRIQYWNEGRDQSGFYDWQDVNDALSSYDQLDGPEVPARIPSEQDLPVFEIQSLPNKGKGLVARVNIARGKRILCEKPLFTLRNYTSKGLMESCVAAQLRELSKPEQRQFLSLHNNFPGKFPFTGLINTNARPCGPNSDLGGIFLTISLINHSCLPNAYSNWNSVLGRQTIHAIRSIKSGEEITITYEKGAASDARHAHLKRNFGFDCACALCALAPAKIELSDARRREIQLLDEVLGEPGRMFARPDDSLADCRRVVQIVREEFRGSGSGPWLAAVYHDAFEIAIMQSDQARAGMFAKRAYRWRVICEGEDSAESMRVKALMDDPSSYMRFGYSRRWRTAKGMVPRGLDVQGFEDWLWRQGR